MVNDRFNEAKRKNLIRIMEERGLKAVDLARLIERDPPYIAALLRPTGEKGSRNLGRKLLKILCEKLKVNEGEFYIGVDIFDTIDIPSRRSAPIAVISWVHAGMFAEPIDRWPDTITGEGEYMFSCCKVGTHAFGLKIVGDSMSPRYLPGDTIIVDPEVRCDNGCPCIVCVNGEVSFKVIHETEEEIRLHPLNNRYPDTIINKDSQADFRIIGKVVDMIPKL